MAVKSSEVKIASEMCIRDSGTIIATGTPEEVAANPTSYTGQYLKEKLHQK